MVYVNTDSVTQDYEYPLALRYADISTPANFVYRASNRGKRSWREYESRIVANKRLRGDYVTEVATQSRLNFHQKIKTPVSVQIQG